MTLALKIHDLDTVALALVPLSARAAIPACGAV